MRLSDQFRFNLQLFVRHRVRTILLLLAVGAGVASVILLTSLGEGARRYIDSEFSSLGNSLLVILPWKKETTGGTPPIYGANPRDLTLEDAYALEKLPGVSYVAPIIAGTSAVSRDALSREIIVIGTTSAYFQIRELEVSQGSKFPARVRDEAMPVCILGAKVRRELFGAKQAIRLGRELEEFNLAWLEEPVAYQDLRACAEVRSALTTPIAAGETEYTRYGMRDILQAQAVDVLMPDLQRMGGYSEMRRACALAAAHDVPVSTHLFTEHSLCIAGAEPNCISVEHMPWYASLFNESMNIRDGMIDIPDRPGTGFSFNAEAIQRYRLTS